MGMNLEKYEKPGQKIQQNTKIGDPSTRFFYLQPQVRPPKELCPIYLMTICFKCLTVLPTDDNEKLLTSYLQYRPL